MMLKQSNLCSMKMLDLARGKWVLLCRCGVQFLFSGLKRLQDSVQSQTSFVKFLSCWFVKDIGRDFFFRYHCQTHLFLMSVQRYDPTYEATRLHFEDLVERYGNPIIVLNLIKVSFSMKTIAYSFSISSQSNRLQFCNTSCNLIMRVKKRVELEY